MDKKVFIPILFGQVLFGQLFYQWTKRIMILIKISKYACYINTFTSHFLFLSYTMHSLRLLLAISVYQLTFLLPYFPLDEGFVNSIYNDTMTS